MSLEATLPSETVESVAVEDKAPPPAEIYESAAAVQLRITLVRDQLIAAAKQVNLLHAMGLERTSGYADAMALYESKQADLDALKARYRF